MCPEAAAMNCKTFFEASVFPEPDSPLNEEIEGKLGKIEQKEEISVDWGVGNDFVKKFF